MSVRTRILTHLLFLLYLAGIFGIFLLSELAGQLVIAVFAGFALSDFTKATARLFTGDSAATPTVRR